MKINFGKIQHMVMHQVGNRHRGEGVRFSSEETTLADAEDDLLNIIKSSFKMNELYQFYFEPHLSLNPVFTLVKPIFDDDELFIKQTRNISKYLYKKTFHPQVKSGDLCFIYLKDCKVEENSFDALCIFKSEMKESVLQIQPSENGFTLTKRQGISLNNIDKGCLILNLDSENGYKIAIIDKVKKTEEIQYWLEDFLSVRPIENSFHKTQTVMNMVTSYLNEECDQLIGNDKAQKAAITNKCLEILSKPTEISLSILAEGAFEDQTLRNDFLRYSESYQADNNDYLGDEKWLVQKSAVSKKGLKKLRVIKLDKNFEIYIHGDNKYITKGYDDSLSMDYYQLYFKKEK